MISSIIDAVLLTALVATSVCVLLMYRRLQRFDVLQSEAAKAFVQSAQALEEAKASLDTLNAGGGELAVGLAARLNEARLVLNELDHEIMSLRDRPAVTPQEPAPAPPPERHAPAQQAAATAQSDAAASPQPPAAARIPSVAEAVNAGWNARFEGLRHKLEEAAGSVRIGELTPAGASAPTPPAQHVTPTAALSVPATAITWKRLSEAAQHAA